MAGFEAMAPVPTVVGGYSGQLIELTSRAQSGLPHRSLWTIPQGRSSTGIRWSERGGSRPDSFRIVEINGTLLVLRTTDFANRHQTSSSKGIPDNPKRHAADQVAMQQILDSIRITTAPAQP